MAEPPVEVVIRARNDAQAALNQAVGQLKLLEGGAKAAGAAGSHLQALRTPLQLVAPAAANAVAQVEQLTSAGAAFGPMGVAIGGVVAAIGLVGAAGVTAAKRPADTVEQLDNLSRV